MGPPFMGYPFGPPPMGPFPMNPPFGGDNHHHGDTVTPIKHVIILIGENRGLDHTFGVYKPKGRGQFISNLLSEGIVKEDGSPGPNYWMTQQYSVAGQSSYYVDAPDYAKQPYNATNHMRLPQVTDSAVTQTDTGAPFAPALVTPGSPVNLVKEQDIDSSATTKLTTGSVSQKVFGVCIVVARAQRLCTGSRGQPEHGSLCASRSAFRSADFPTFIGSGCGIAAGL